MKYKGMISRYLTLDDGSPHGPHQSHKIRNVVFGEQLCGQGIVVFECGMYECFGVIFAGGAWACGIDRFQRSRTVFGLETQRT